MATDRLRKDSRLSFRIHADEKKKLEAIAREEGQSVARICEAFLLAGFDSYGKQGARFLQQYIGRTRGTIPQ
jgi:hypothetical protein